MARRDIGMCCRMEARNPSCKYYLKMGNCARTALVAWGPWYNINWELSLYSRAGVGVDQIHILEVKKLHPPVLFVSHDFSLLVLYFIAPLDPNSSSSNESPIEEHETRHQQDNYAPGQTTAYYLSRSAKLARAKDALRPTVSSRGLTQGMA